MQRLAPFSLLAALSIACGPPSGIAEYSAAEARERMGAPRSSGPGADRDPVPDGRLPEGVTPRAYTIWMEVIPNRDRFRGRVDIRVELARAERTIWLHGLGLNVTNAEALPDAEEPVSARYTQESDDGVASLRFDQPVGPGEVILSLTYDAAFDRQLKGLYRVDTGGDSYAFTQFEATSARLAFPCFDEPRFKTPFELTLSVSPDHQAIANTAPAGERTVGSMKEVRFAATEAIPTYLVAMAVGPLDVVEHTAIPANGVRDRAIPFRGVAARGRGERLRYALEHTAPLVAYLEEYFGIPYPYDKLDIIAVPDFASGAMENVGAITFREQMLLIDPETAPEDQRRTFAHIMAHELAHMWFGNLVTMPWWDDIWLNEAFATWMASKTVRAVHPEYQADVGMASGAHSAMRADSLVSARQIRQPIDSNHDIRNAFDTITYVKGMAVLAMFERWLGEDEFQNGIREYLGAHRFGSATSEDLLDALSRVSGRDVGTPFRTFLMQPGVPLVEMELACEGEQRAVRVRQSRFLPVGSEGDRAQRWQIPICVRYPSGREQRTQCELLTEPEATIALESASCPAWIMPNAEAAGYYRWSMPPAGVDALMRSGYARLEARERLSVADNLIAGFDADAIDAAAVYAVLDRIAADPARNVATTPMSLLSWTREHLSDDARRPVIERFAAQLYQRRVRSLGWAPRRNEDGETSLLRRDLLSFLAFTARDAAVRREAAARGRRYVGFGADGQIHADAVPNDLVGVALAVAVQESDAAFFDHVLDLFMRSEDALFRMRALSALGSTRDQALGARALELAIDPRVRVNEVTETLSAQLSSMETRGSAWAWMREHFDPVFSRVATTRAGFAPWSAAGFCTPDRAAEVQAFFGPRIDALPGGPRNLRGALEAIRLCAARREAQRESAETFFSSRR
jgi:cytosol alanyl aminopeptidase